MFKLFFFLALSSANHHFEVLIGASNFCLPNQNSEDDWNTALRACPKGHSPAQTQSHFQCYNDDCEKNSNSNGAQTIYMTDKNGYPLAFPDEPTDSSLAKVYSSNGYYYNHLQMSWNSSGGDVHFYYYNSEIGDLEVYPYCVISGSGETTSYTLYFGASENQGNSTIGLCSLWEISYWQITW